MLSEHELFQKVRGIYPQVSKIESECLNLFNMEWPCGSGPTGVRGESELAWCIEYLRSSANMLERIGKHRDIL